MTLDGRVSALVEWDDGSTKATSGQAEFCQDGCSTATGSGLGLCDDGDPCTEDDCDVGGCTGAVDLGASCSDGNGCTTGETCDAGGACSGGSAVSPCDACQDDVAGVGVVYRVCEWDSDFCTIQACDPGTGCVTTSEPAHNCDDGNDCTSDWCDSTAETCEHEARGATFRCDDGDLCTGFGTCDGAGTCATVDPVACPYDAGNDCLSTGSCSSAAGCTYTLSTNGPCGTLTDTDGDGFPDVWEDDGYIDYNCDGDEDIGEARPDVAWDKFVPNVLVEIDWMGDDPVNDSGYTDAHRPSDAVLAAVEDAFADAPSGEDVVLQLLRDDEIPHAMALNPTGYEAPQDPDCDDWVSFYDIKRQYFDAKHKGLYHYAVLGHYRVPESASPPPSPAADGNCAYSTSSGAGEVRGDDFSVTLSASSYADAVKLRGTIAHELGHNLGLNHGGGNTTNYKANYISVLNYRWQFTNVYEYDTGVVDTGFIHDPSEVNGSPVVDYSREALATLVESSLNETTSLGATDSRGRLTVIKNCQGISADAYFKKDELIDYNCDGDTSDTSLTLDINQTNGSSETMAGYDDWANLDVDAVCNTADVDFNDGPQADAVSGVEPQEAVARRDHLPPWFPDARLEPWCGGGPVGAGYGGVRVVIFGDEAFAPQDITDAALMGSGPDDYRDLYLNGDSILDRLFVFDSASLVKSQAAEVVYFTGRLSDERNVFARLTYWEVPVVPATHDPDADGYINACDDCPEHAGSVTSGDGCP